MNKENSAWWLAVKRSGVRVSSAPPFFLFALVLCLIFVLCDLFNPQEFAKVIMVDGPSPTSKVLFKISVKEKKCG